jgi:site-specific DNA-cytosine methylase
MTAPTIRLRYAELFAGAGGMGLGLERAGLECAWNAENADFPRSVLQYRHPAVPLYGDVTTLDGRALVERHGPIDLLAGGSPCQDLSVAGKRAGLEGARSGLFYHQARLFEETGATYCLWENVHGALSSHAGRDFALVLSTFVGATVRVPAGRWGGAGVAAGPAGVAAWRVLNAQHMGVPQRRRRVFVLVARAGGACPAQILLEPEGLPWDSRARQRARLEAAGGPRGGTRGPVRAYSFQPNAGPNAGGNALAADFTGTLAGAGGGNGLAVLPVEPVEEAPAEGVLVFTDRGRPGGRQLEYSEDVAYCLTAKDGGGRTQENNLLPIAFHHKQDPISGEGFSPALGTTAQGMGVLSFAQNQRGELRVSEVIPSLGAGGGKPGEGYPAIFNETGFEKWTAEEVAGSLNAHEAKEAHSIVLDHAAAAESSDPFAFKAAFFTRGNTGKPSEVVHTLTAGDGDTGDQNNLVCDPRDPAALEGTEGDARVFKASHFTRGKDGAPSEVAPALSADADRGDQDLLVYGAGDLPMSARVATGEVLPTLTSQGGDNGTEGPKVFTKASGGPRRLMPLECERLMSWPDHWTDVPVRTEKRKAMTYKKDPERVGVRVEKRLVAASDSARYKAIGNGVASVQPEWIAGRLLDALEGSAPDPTPPPFAGTPMDALFNP